LVNLNRDYYEIPSSDNTVKVAVSFCKLLTPDNLKNLGCTNTTVKTMAVYIANNTCHTLSGPDMTKNANFEVADPKASNGLNILYTGGDSGYNMTLDLKCIDKNESFVDPSINSTANNFIKAGFKSRNGCKNGQLSAIWEWFKSNKWAMFTFFLIAGLFTCFLGRTLFKPIVFIVSLSFVSSLILVIAYNTFLISNTKSWVGWVVLAVAVLAGLAVGCLFIKFVKLAIFIVAAWGGYALSLLIYNAFMYKMNSDAGFWCFTIGTALVCGVLSLCFFDHILIHATAFLGAYMAVFGVGLVAGRYTNPFTIVEMIRNKQITSVDPVFYAYMAGNIVLYFLGMVYQYRIKNGKPDHDPYGHKGHYNRRY